MPDPYPPLSAITNSDITRGTLGMANDSGRKSRMQYVWPWLGIAAIIAVMWAVVAE